MVTDKTDIWLMGLGRKVSDWDGNLSDYENDVNAITLDQTRIIEGQGIYF